MWAWRATAAADTGDDDVGDGVGGDSEDGEDRDDTGNKTDEGNERPRGNGEGKD